MLPVIPSTAITAACHPNVKKLSMRLRLLPMDTPKTKSKAHTVTCMLHLLIPLKEQRPRKRYPTPVPMINKIKIRNMVDRFYAAERNKWLYPVASDCYCTNMMRMWMPVSVVKSRGTGDRATIGQINPLNQWTCTVEEVREQAPLDSI